MTLVTYHRPRAIRRARLDERQRIADLANAAFAPKDRTAWIEDAFDRHDRTILVFDRLGAAAGFVITRTDGNTLVIDLIGTDNPRRGIGQALLVAAEATAPAHCGDVRAGTYADNKTARRFYEALGFAIK